MAVFCVAKLESMQIKAALFVLNDILTELSDLSRTFQKSDITLMEAQAVAGSRITKLQAQYLGEQKHWSVSVQNLNNKSALTMDKMAPVVRFIKRLCAHLKDRFPEDNKLCTVFSGLLAAPDYKPHLTNFSQKKTVTYKPHPTISRIFKAREIFKHFITCYENYDETRLSISKWKVKT